VLILWHLENASADQFTPIVGRVFTVTGDSRDGAYRKVRFEFCFSQAIFLVHSYRAESSQLHPIGTFLVAGRFVKAYRFFRIL